jgi:hypothetical protein
LEVLPQWFPSFVTTSIDPFDPMSASIGQKKHNDPITGDSERIGQQQQQQQLLSLSPNQQKCPH